MRSIIVPRTRWRRTLKCQGNKSFVTARGNRRESLFYDEQDRQGFLGRVAALLERFGIEVHAFVLLDNHYHLLLRTPEPNVSQATQWLNVRRMEGLKYGAAAQAVRRFDERQASNPDMRRFVANLRRQSEMATEGR